LIQFGQLTMWQQTDYFQILQQQKQQISIL